MGVWSVIASGVCFINMISICCICYHPNNRGRKRQNFYARMMESDWLIEICFQDSLYYINTYFSFGIYNNMQKKLYQRLRELQKTIPVEAKFTI